MDTLNESQPQRQATASQEFISFRQLLERPDIKAILIPRIQRSYAQGRLDAHATRTRRRFLQALHKGLLDPQGMTLDFIYGTTRSEDKAFIPLDGQQRLTTLFLLHWYASLRQDVPAPQREFLLRFSYATRPAARDFCKHLAMVRDVDLNSHVPVSRQLTDQPWFPMDWRREPTIASMLVMLDAISEEFADVPQIWERLDNVRFHFKTLEELSLTDDIYIKMNSRGKPLTPFEHFKAELQRVAAETMGEDYAEGLIAKVDGPWTDMLWPHHDSEGQIDAAFMHLFRYVFDILRWRMACEAPSRTDDEFQLLQDYLKGQKAPENFRTLEAYFDRWCQIPDTASYFDEYISTREHAEGKIVRWWKQAFGGTDLLGACMSGYGTDTFTLPQTLMLEAFNTSLLHPTTDQDLRRRLRIIGNLVENSSDEIRADRMPGLLDQMRGIMLTGRVDADLERGFNGFQLREEAEKTALLDQNPELASDLFCLEDLPLLRGKVAAVGLDRPELWKRLPRLFADCNLDLVDRALLASGDYWQRIAWYGIQTGTSGSDLYRDDCESVWRRVFHDNRGIPGLRQSLCRVLSLAELPNDQLLEEVAQEYMEDCHQRGRYPWQYYYVSYPEFRPGRWGRYDFVVEKPYEMIWVYAPRITSSNSRQPFMMAIAQDNAPVTDVRYCRVSPDRWMVCFQDALAVVDQEEKEVERLPITQTAEGVDTEDRVAKGRQWLADLLSRAQDPMSSAE